MDPFYHTYICKDGRPFYVVAPCHAAHQKRCLEALELYDGMVALGLPEGDVYANSDEWRDPAGKPANCILGTYPITDPAWIVRLRDAMKAAFTTRPALEWEKVFMALKIPGAATRTTSEWLKTEHATASGLVVERAMASKTRGEKATAVKTSGPVVWLTRSSVPGSDALRRRCKAAARNALDGASESSLWLKGTKVVDLSNVIAGPTIGGVLSRFGADVVKVDAAKPTYDALVAVFMGVPIRATQGGFHCHLLSSRVFRSDHKGLKNNASTLFKRDLEER